MKFKRNCPRGFYHAGLTCVLFVWSGLGLPSLTLGQVIGTGTDRPEQDSEVVEATEADVVAKELRDLIESSKSIEPESTQGIEPESTQGIEPESSENLKAKANVQPLGKLETSRNLDAGSNTVRFYFERTPWRDVIRWIAEEADLALHVGELPTGSFTYTDPSDFTHQEAIDRINLFLLPEGFTLIRSGQLLSVINLANPRSSQQLDALAEFINIEELAERPDHDVVKCILPLGEIDAGEAVQELSVLKLMSTPEVLSKTNQLLIVDTVARLRNVQKVLDAFRKDQLDNGTVVKSFTLQHVNAEDILEVARPHLGLAPEETIGIDVSVSSDLKGKNIFVTGVEDKVKLLEGLVQAIDQPKASLSTSGGQAELRNYVLEGGNAETVYNVLQTLLAGKDVRLSVDEETDSLVALASPAVQREIEQTVQQLQATQAGFEVIQLKTADPFMVISLLEEMLDLPGPFDDPDDFDVNSPKIDADPVNRRLFVRAKVSQIEQIKQIVSELDSSPTANTSNLMRLFPLRGNQAEAILESAAKFWRGENPVVLYRSLDRADSETTERVLTDEAPAKPANTKPREVDTGFQRWLTTNVHNSAAVIRCQLTPRGLLMQSEDNVALNEFEDHLRLVTAPFESLPSPPIVYYLKYTKADDAIRMLSELLEGGEAANLASESSLVNGYVSSSDSFFGSFVSSAAGTMTLTSGTMTVVADSRLNRLIAQGSAEEIEQIEQYLKIIDKDNSITSVETYGTSHVIELVNTQAKEVAEALREAFAGRVITSDKGQASNQQQGGNSKPQVTQQNGSKRTNQDDDGRNSKNSKQPEPRASGQPIRDLEPKMTIAVHEPSNSLIVTAPQPLYEEAEKLARAIDSRSEQMVEVVIPANGQVFEDVLQQFLGQPPTRRSSSSGSSFGRSDRPSASSFRERNEK